MWHFRVSYVGPSDRFAGTVVRRLALQIDANKLIPILKHTD